MATRFEAGSNRSMVELKVTFVISPNECKMGSAAERLHVGAGVGLGAGLGIGLGLGCGARYLGYVSKCIMLCTGTVSILSVSIHGFLGKALSEKTDVRPEKRTNSSSWNINYFICPSLSHPKCWLRLKLCTMT